MKLQVYLETAVALARQAGELIRESFGGEFKKGCKSCPVNYDKIFFVN